MACHHPIRAWRTNSGNVLLNRAIPDAAPLALPCGGCLGCRTAAAKEWALRCQLELHQHTQTGFTTLTYSDDNVPLTLQKRDLQLFLKRLRKAAARPIRFFASGEYGETTGRPHYHAILYGINANENTLVQNTWAQGHTYTTSVNPARIAYCAGYTSKKIGYKQGPRERVDPDTGECYDWQPPFIQMSRRPGIGGEARQYANSWRAYAIQNGTHMPVPKFLHKAWEAQATSDELAQLEYEKQQHRQGKPNTTTETLKAAELIAVAQQRIKADKRKY